MKENKIFAVTNLDAEDLGSSIIRTYWTSEEAHSELEKIEDGTHPEFFKNLVCDVFEITLPEPVNPPKEQSTCEYHKHNTCMCKDSCEKAAKKQEETVSEAAKRTSDEIGLLLGAAYHHKLGFEKGAQWQSAHQSEAIQNLQQIGIDKQETISNLTKVIKGDKEKIAEKDGEIERLKDEVNRLTEYNANENSFAAADMETRWEAARDKLADWIQSDIDMHVSYDHPGAQPVISALQTTLNRIKALSID